MSSARGLTGGTGDVNPQYLTVVAPQSGADTTTTTQVALPIQRLPNAARAQVMELLKIYYTIGSTPTEVDNFVEVTLSTTSFGTTATNFGEPRVFSTYRRVVAITTSGQIVYQEPFVQDLTDGAGHGILVATDSIFVQIVSATTGATNIARIKIMYRMKNVSLAEYIGVVQSQQ